MVKGILYQSLILKLTNKEEYAELTNFAPSHIEENVSKLHGSNGVEEKIDGLQEDEGIDEGGFLFQEDRCETWASTSFPNHEMPVLHKSLIQQWIH